MGLGMWPRRFETFVRTMSDQGKGRRQSREGIQDGVG